MVLIEFDPSERSFALARHTILAFAVAAGGCGDAKVTSPRLEPCPPGFSRIDARCEVAEVYFEGGRFTMGRAYCFPFEDHEQDFASDDCRLADRPHEVEVPPFYLDATPFVAGWACPWEGCVEPEAHYDAFLPWVSYDQIQAYCEGRGKTLVDEAQWEFAASAGGKRAYPWGDEPATCTETLLDGCAVPARPAAVAQYPSTSEGVYDLSSGWGEWVAPAPTAYADGYEALPVQGGGDFCECASLGCDACKQYGVRGGGYFAPPTFRQSARRDMVPNGTDMLSFRCARHP